MACAVPGCRSHTGRKKNECEYVSFHRISEDKKLIWKGAIPGVPFFSKSSRICSKHFEKNCFQNGNYKWRKLKQDAIPTLFPETDLIREGLGSPEPESPSPQDDTTDNSLIDDDETKPQPDLQYPSDEEQFSQSELVQLLKAAKLRVADLTRKNQELEKSVKKLSKEKMGLNNDLQVLQKLNEGLSKRCQRTEQRNYQLRQRLRQLGDTQSSPDEESDDDDEEPEHPQPTRRRKADDSDTTDQDDDNPEESQPFQDLLQISHEEDVKVLVGLPPQVVNRKKGGPAKRTRPTLSGKKQPSCSSLNARGQALTSFKVESLSAEEPSAPSGSNKRTEPGVLGEPGGSNDPLSLIPVTEIKVEEIKIEVDDGDVFTVMDTV